MVRQLGLIAAFSLVMLSSFSGTAQAEVSKSERYSTRHRVKEHRGKATASSANSVASTVASAPSSADSDGSGGGIGFILMVGAGVAILVMRDRGRTKRRRTHVEQLLQEGREWTANVKSTGKIPPPDTGSIIIPKGETAILAETSSLYELRADSTRHYLGTRIKVGKLPVYIGSSKAANKKKILTATASGKLALTDKGIIFAGSARTARIKAVDIVSVEATIDSIVVSSGHRAAPFVFAVSNPFKWSAAVKMVASGELTVNH